MADVDDTGRLTMLADLLERLPTPVAYVTGPEQTVTLANEAYRRLVGGRDVEGLPVLEALPEVDRQAQLEKLDLARRTGRRAEGHETALEVRDETGALEKVVLDFVYQPVHDQHGAVAGVLLHAVDVTTHVQDRRRLEKLTAELDGARERYQTLFETMVHGVVYHGADGAIFAANPAAAETLGVGVDDLIGMRPQGPQWEAVREDGSPFPGDQHPAMVALRTGHIVPDVVMGVRHGVTGERRWLAVTAVPDARDDEGRPQRAYAMFRDITEMRRTAVALRDRDSLLGRLRDADVLGFAVANEDRVLDANGAFLRMVGYTQDDLAAGRLSWRAMTPPEWAYMDDRAIEQLRATGASAPFEKELTHRSGRRVPVLLGAAVIEREPITWVTFVADLSERQQAEQERAKLVASAHAARIEAKNAEERLGLLLGAGDLVAATRSREDLLGQVTRLVVPSLADCAIVFLPTEEGGLRATAAEGGDPTATAVLASLLEEPLEPSGSVAFQAAYRTGHSQLVQDVTRHRDTSPQLDPRLGEIADLLHTDSIVAVALAQGGDHLGVLALGRSDSRPAFTVSDVAVAEELGRRISEGLANVDTFAREHSVSEILQRSVLPDVLPSVPGVDLAVVYLPATEGVDVGGDWYDAFHLGDEVLGLVIGDVVGHNLASASAMSQVRNAVRALAVDDPDPSKVLRRTNSALARLLPDALATVFYAVLDLRAGRLDYANAGHPPPLLIAPEGPCYLSGQGGLMLGAAEDAAYEVATEPVRPGTGLLLYSDGLVEDRSRSIDQGLETLAAAFADLTLRSADEICATAQGALLRTETRADDVCLLAVRVLP